MEKTVRSRRDRPALRALDAERVERAKRGDARAFAELYAGVSERAIRVAQQVTRDRHEAEDAVQEGFLVAFRGLERLKDPSSFEGWLIRIVRNNAVDRARRMSRCRPSLRAHDEDSDLAPTLPKVMRRTGAAEPRPESITQFRDELASLSDCVRETVRLRYQTGLSVRKVARLQGISRSCVKTRLHRVRERLRDAMLPG